MKNDEVWKYINEFSLRESPRLSNYINKKTNSDVDKLKLLISLATDALSNKNKAKSVVDRNRSGVMPSCRVRPPAPSPLSAKWEKPPRPRTANLERTFPRNVASLTALNYKRSPIEIADRLIRLYTF